MDPNFGVDRSAVGSAEAGVPTGIGSGLRPSVLRTRRSASPLLPALRSGRRTQGQRLRRCRRRPAAILIPVGT